MSRTLAELHRLLARAFLPPTDPAAAATFRRGLAGDLEALANELSFECAGPVSRLRDGLDALADDAHLMQTYSTLFLQPPIRIHLNAAAHLDGALSGPSAKRIEEACRRHGLCLAEPPRDRPDHVSRLIECVGLLFARAAGAGDAGRAAALSAEARAFSAAFLRPWLPGFAVEVRDVCEELGLTSPYPHLAELAAIVAWEGDAWRRAGPEGAAHDGPRQTACGACGQPFAEEAALTAVRRIMEKRGLDVAHLDRCPNCRGLSDPGPVETRPVPDPGIRSVH